jgi:hypothetical protein
MEFGYFIFAFGGVKRLLGSKVAQIDTHVRKMRNFATTVF